MWTHCALGGLCMEMKWNEAPLRFRMIPDESRWFVLIPFDSFWLYSCSVGEIDLGHLVTLFTAVCLLHGWLLSVQLHKLAKPKRNKHIFKHTTISQSHPKSTITLFGREHWVEQENSHLSCLYSKQDCIPSLYISAIRVKVFHGKMCQRKNSWRVLQSVVAGGHVTVSCNFMSSSTTGYTTSLHKRIA